MADEHPNARNFPWWFPGWPDGRLLCGAGVFVLLVGLLVMIYANPALLDSTPFMQLVTVIASSLGVVVAFHFGSSSGSAKANQRADQADRRAAAATASTTDSAEATRV